MVFTGLIGRHEHTIDTNGRLSIPVKFRDYLMSHSEGTVVMTVAHVDSCVVAYPLSEWEKITKRASLGESGKDFTLKKDIWDTVFFSRAESCQLDKQGRILIPSQLRDYAGLDRELMLVGCVFSFKVWDVNKWKEKEARVLEDPERLQEAMASLGI